MPKYRINYVIERADDDSSDYAEIGFGSIAGDGTIDAALYQVQSDIQNRQWETSEGMPDPAEVDRG